MALGTIAINKQYRDRQNVCRLMGYTTKIHRLPWPKDAGLCLEVRVKTYQTCLIVPAALRHTGDTIEVSRSVIRVNKPVPI